MRATAVADFWRTPSQAQIGLVVRQLPMQAPVLCTDSQACINLGCSQAVAKLVGANFEECVSTRMHDILIRRGKFAWPPSVASVTVAPDYAPVQGPL